MPKLRMPTDDELCADLNVKKSELRALQTTAAAAIRASDWADYSALAEARWHDICNWCWQLPALFIAGVVSLLDWFAWIITTAWRNKLKLIILTCALFLFVGTAIFHQIEGELCRRPTVQRLSWSLSGITGRDGCKIWQDWEEERLRGERAIQEAKEAFERVPPSAATIAGIQGLVADTLRQSQGLSRFVEQLNPSVMNGDALVNQTKIVTQMFAEQNEQLVLFVPHVLSFQHSSAVHAEDLEHRIVQYFDWRGDHSWQALVLDASLDWVPRLGKYQTRPKLDYESYMFLSNVVSQADADQAKSAELVQFAGASLELLHKLDNEMTNSHKSYLVACSKYNRHQNLSAWKLQDWPDLFVFAMSKDDLTLPDMCRYVSEGLHREAVAEMKDGVKTIIRLGESDQQEMSKVRDSLLNVMNAGQQQLMTLEREEPVGSGGEEEKNEGDETSTSTDKTWKRPDSFDTWLQSQRPATLIGPALRELLQVVQGEKSRKTEGGEKKSSEKLKRALLTLEL